MTEPRDVPQAPGALERFARDFLAKRMGSPGAAAPADPVHILSPAERAEINQIVTGTMWRSALIGVLSAGACVAVEIVDPGASPLAKWLWMLIVSAISAVGEVAYLYWKHLDSVSALARVTGASLFAGRDVRGDLVAGALARAALELPDPLDVIKGVDPRREAPKWLLFAGGLVYKLKYSATNFLFKLLLRRFLARSVLRFYAPLVALPLAAFWNGYVSWKVLREARLRAVGPSAIAEVFDGYLAQQPAPSPALQEAFFRAAAVAVVGKQDAHPNLVLLYRALEARYGAAAYPGLDEPARLAEHLAALSPEEQRQALAVYQFASILDGALSPREEEIAQQLAARTGRDYRPDPLRGVLALFVRGLALDARALQLLAT